MYFNIESHLRHLENGFNQLARILRDNNNITIIPGSNGEPLSIRYTGHMEQNIVYLLTMSRNTVLLTNPSNLVRKISLLPKPITLLPSTLCIK